MSRSQSRASTLSSTNTASSLTPELDKLTTAVLEVTDNIQACSQASDEHHQAYLAHVEAQKKQTKSIQDALAQMLAMTQEGLKRDAEQPLKVPNSQKFRRDLQRAAFGTGGDSDSASRSSMLEARELAASSANTSSRPDSVPQQREWQAGSPGSVRASQGSVSSQSSLLSDTSSWQEV